MGTMKLLFSLFLISKNEIAASSNNDQWKNVDPLVKTNRFLSLGGLDQYMDQNQACQEGWKHLRNKCLILLNENQKKIDHKRSCLQLGAQLVTVNSKKENDDIFKFLNESNFVENGTSDHVWLGMNSGKRTGHYVIHNLKLTVDWFNWDQSSDQNESGSKNSVQLNAATGTWFRTTRNGRAAAICSKAIYP